MVSIVVQYHEQTQAWYHHIFIQLSLYYPVAWCCFSIWALPSSSYLTAGETLHFEANVRHAPSLYPERMELTISDSLNVCTWFVVLDPY
jgi:hypothetical protein